jgi:hypothetical protein
VNLVSRVSNHMIGLVSPYRFDHSQSMVLKHFIKHLLCLQVEFITVGKRKVWRFS